MHWGLKCTSRVAHHLERHLALVGLLHAAGLQRVDERAQDQPVPQLLCEIAGALAFLELPPRAGGFENLADPPSHLRLQL